MLIVANNTILKKGNSHYLVNLVFSKIYNSCFEILKGDILKLTRLSLKQKFELYFLRCKM